eukprot:3143838-Rhodomonas_salina.1
MLLEPPPQTKLNTASVVTHRDPVTVVARPGPRRIMRPACEPEWGPSEFKPGPSPNLARTVAGRAAPA